MSNGAVTCRVCGGYGFIAVKRYLDDGYGEVDSCPACDERDNLEGPAGGARAGQTEPTQSTGTLKAKVGESPRDF